jgi:hypothetical protein
VCVGCPYFWKGQSASLSNNGDKEKWNWSAAGGGCLSSVIRGRQSVAFQLLTNPPRLSLCLYPIFLFPLKFLRNFTGLNRLSSVCGRRKNQNSGNKMIGMWSFSAGHWTRNNSTCKCKILLGFFTRFFSRVSQKPQTFLFCFFVSLVKLLWEIALVAYFVADLCLLKLEFYWRPSAWKSMRIFLHLRKLPCSRLFFFLFSRTLTECLCRSLAVWPYGLECFQRTNPTSKWRGRSVKCFFTVNHLRKLRQLSRSVCITFGSLPIDLK